MRRVSCYIAATLLLCGFTNIFAQKKWQLMRPGPARTTAKSFASPAAQQQELWQLQTTLPGNPVLTSVKAVSRDVAWTCSDDGRVFRTVDGGKTWIQKTTVTADEELYCIQALDSTTAFAGGAGSLVGGGDAKIYRTTNGGQSWNAVYTGTGAASFWDGIHFFDAQNGIALSDPPVVSGNYLIVKTADGGATWTPISNPPGANTNEFGLLNCFYFYDNLNGWFGTGAAQQGAIAGRVFRTTDGGNTWSGFNSGNTGFVLDVRFISPLVGVRTSTSSPFLTRSTDGGQTWTAVTNLPITGIQAMYSAGVVNTASLNQLWVHGESGQNFTPFILTSTDGGVTWQEQSLAAIPGYSTSHMSAVGFGAANDSVQAWAVTVDVVNFPGGGPVLNYRAALGTTTTVRERPSNIPAAFRLLQNYPNPFNPSTTIQFSLPSPLFVSLQVFDVLGREVEMLVSRKLTAGSYEIRFDGSKLATGIYTYRLHAGDFIETRKMILVK